MPDWKKVAGSAMSGASGGLGAAMEAEDAQAKRECEKNGGRWSVINRKCVGGDVQRRPLESTPVAQDLGITVPQVRPVGVSRRNGY
jgi:hypothetical protein